MLYDPMKCSWVADWAQEWDVWGEWDRTVVTEHVTVTVAACNGLARGECLSGDLSGRLLGSAGCRTWHPEARSRFGATCTSLDGHGGAVQDPPAIGWERAVALGQSSGRALLAPSPLPRVPVAFEPAPWYSSASPEGEG